MTSTLTRSPSLAEVITEAIKYRIEGVHTSMPGVVTDYDALTQLATVQPSIKRRLDDGTASDLPVVRNVPLCFPRAGGFFVSFPVAVGDSVLLVFAERSIDQWLERGGSVDPLVEDMHSLTDAIAIPGVYAKNDALQSAHAQHMVLGPDTPSAPRAYFKAGEIALGGESPNEFVALANMVLTELNKINLHEHPVTTAPGTSGPPTPTIAFVAPAATKVKAL